MLRTLAACLGLFGLLNCALGFVRPQWDANLWWIDLRGLPDPAGRALVACACALLALHAAFPSPDSTRRYATAIAAAGLAVVCVWNGIEFVRLLWTGSIRAGVPVPLSFITAGLLSAVAWSVWRANPGAAPAFNPYWAAGVAVACLIAFPLAQMYFFGKTDYSRPADAALVFGARAYADGRPSQALYDRVRTACDLQRAGVVKTLIFSGGPGDGAFHETDVMRRIALHRGVPAEAIVVDLQGLNTRMSLENLKPLCAELHARRVLAVSHFYHLPRIKLEAQRLGMEIYTVPARETYPLTKMPLLMAREVAALWKYYVLAGTIQRD
jgi:vancomycin permeability regulator SanA